MQAKSNLGGPRPFGGNVPLGGPRSPAYNTNNQNTWSQPVYTPPSAPVSNNYNNYGSHTLPRSNASGTFFSKKTSQLFY